MASEFGQTVGIFCRDMRFYRLLAVQLEMCRVTSVANLAQNPHVAARCDLWLVNVDDFPLETLPTPPVDCHIWGFGRCPATMQACWGRDIHIWHRPFSMAHFEKMIENWLAHMPHSGNASIGSMPSAQPTPPPIDTAIRVLQEGVVAVGEKQVMLTGQEWVLFEHLWQHKGRVVSKETLQGLLHVTSKQNHDTSTNKIEVYICFLRRKLEKTTGRRYIQTVRGVGYVLDT